MEGSHGLYVKVGMFDALEQSKVCVLTITRIGVVTVTSASAKCTSVRKPHAILPDTVGYDASGSKYFQKLTDPPGAKQCTVRLCKSIFRCP